MNARQHREFQIPRLKPVASALRFSPLTRKSPITRSAKDLLTICQQILAVFSPFALRFCTEKGIDIPTIKRKAGKTTSDNPIPTSSAFVCSSHSGIFVNDQRSLTKIMSSMVIARSTSIEWILNGKAAAGLYMVKLVRQKCKIYPCSLLFVKPIFMNNNVHVVNNWLLPHYKSCTLNTDKSGIN